MARLDAETPERSRMKDSRRTYSIGTSRLQLEFGDLTSARTHVLVSSDDYYLTAGGGVSQAIARAGGPAIRADAAKHVPAHAGDVVVTTAGTLSARYVFHAVTIAPDATDTSPSDVLRRATRRCLELMTVLGLRSIAFPALGTGTAGFAVEDAAATMAAVIAEDLAQRKDPLEVAIFLHSPSRNPLEFLAFYEQLARRVPQLGVPIPAQPTAPAVAPPLPESVRDELERRYLKLQEHLTALEHERQRLEQQLTELLQTGAAPRDVEWLRERLSQNLDKRLESTSEQERLRGEGVPIFLCYARKDQEWRQQLMEHLASLRREGLVTTWYDGEISPGAEWDDEIRLRLRQSRVVLLLLSASFINSEYINSVELKEALDRHRRGLARVIPVVVRDVDWHHSPVGALQGLPRDGRSIADYGTSADKAFVEVVGEIRRALRHLPGAYERPGTKPS